MGPPPPIGSAYLLRFSDVAYRLRMGVHRAWRLRKADPRFPKPVTAPGCLARWLESDVAGYVQRLAAERDAQQGAA